jgi:hypothetical protein
MKRVWIAQCLCPHRHTILATAGEADGAEAAEEQVAAPLREAVEEALQSDVLNPWCGLCRAPAESWRYEVGRTRFRTMEEATPALRRNEAEQAATRQVFGDLPRSD